MFQRQRVLLNVIHELKMTKKYSKRAVEKTLFLLRNEYGFVDKLKFYSFFPYNYGPFSNLSYYDLGKLQGDQCFVNEELTDTGISEAEKLNNELVSEIRECISRFPNPESMVEYVYWKYPEYTVKSKLVSKTDHSGEPGFFTIGYEGKDIDAFLNVLIQNEIEILVDVRHNPFSMNFSFIQKKLAEYLGKSGIGYVHFKGLGINGENRKTLETDEDYGKLFEQYEKEMLPAHLGEFAKVVELGKSKRIAMMCFEHDAGHCHRGVLARKLRENGLRVVDL